MKKTLLGFAMASCVAALMYTQAASAWTLARNFNQGTAGSVAKSNVDGFSGTCAGAFYSYVNVSEGPLAAELNVEGGSTGYGYWGGTFTLPENIQKGGELWFRVKTYMPIGFNYDSTSEGNRLKFIRFHTMSPTSSNEGYDDWYINPRGSKTPFSWIFEGEQKWSDFGGAEDVIQLGQWEVYEMYVYFDDVAVDNGGKARVRLWKNGKLLKDITDRKTLVRTTSYVDRVHLFTYWNGGAPQTQKMWVDDIVLTTDTPLKKDAQGNAFVGLDPSTNYAAPPVAPVAN